MSIYVAVSPDDLHRLRPVLNLLFQQAIGLQTRELPEHNPALKYQLMMLLDEYAAVGRMPIVAEAISYLPGYNVRLVLVFHTPAQLREVYGVHNSETMLKSLAARIVFAPKDYADAREISDELGFTTVKVKSISKPLMEFFDTRGRRSRSQSISEQRRALLLPQEVKELGTEEAIIFYEGLRPIRCRKIRYFADARFRERLLPPPAKPAPQWEALPTPARPTEGASHDNTVTAGEATGSADLRVPELKEPSMAAPSTREAKVEDLERIDSLTREDFATDFSKVKIPDHDGPLSSEEMTTAVESFLNTLRER
jgi:type IV secretion system protein VirD4